MIVAVLLVIGIQMMDPIDHDPMYHCSMALADQENTTEFCTKVVTEK